MLINYFFARNLHCFFKLYPSLKSVSEERGFISSSEESDIGGWISSAYRDIPSPYRVNK